MNSQGNLFVIAAPSGAGKTSLVHALVARLPQLRISISCTTRPARKGERYGEDYFFVEPSQFDQMVAQNDFLEYATVFSYQYGTSRQWVLTQLEQGIDVILEIDWQGARQICQLFPAARSVFILPPSIQALQERLQSRALDSAKVIAERLAAAQQEIQHYHEFHYLVMNDNFSVAVDELAAIVTANRLTLAKQQKKFQSLLADFVKNQ